MDNPIPLAIPEALVEQARAEALLTNRSLEAVLVGWLQRGAPPPNPTYMIYTPVGLDAASQPLADALTTDTTQPPGSPSAT